jgi:predicted dehydrogenase
MTVRVGVVGCGEAAQIMHLPSLRLLGDRFRVTAVADVSASVAARVATGWDVPFQTTDHREVVGRDDVDAVLVACPHAYHADVATAALAHGKHVLVEKPLCLTLREADAIIAAGRAAGRVVQVGYMRRHAPAFAEFCRLVQELAPIRLAHVHDVLGLNELIGDQVVDVIRADDLTEEALGAAWRDEQPLLREAVGDVAPELLHAYRFLLTLNSHDLSAMRGALGRPRRVLYATRRGGEVSPYLTAAFDYGDFVCTLETGFDRIPRADSHLAVYGADRVVRIQYPTGFVRNLPVRVTVLDAAGAGTAEHALEPTWEDPFTSEWLSFHRSIVDGAPVATSAEDARVDLELALELVAHIPESETR